MGDEAGGAGAAPPTSDGTVAVVVASCGMDSWRDEAMRYAVPSVWAQTDPPDEVIVGHEPDMTVEQARNAGAAQATSGWLVFLDADDMLHPGYVAAMRAAAASGAGDRLLSPAMHDVDADTGDSLVAPRLPNRGAPMTEMNHCCIGTAVPRDLFRTVGGFREGYSPWEDWELFLRCIRAGARIHDVPDAVYVARVRTGSRHRSITRRHAVELHRRISSEHAEGKP